MLENRRSTGITEFEGENLFSQVEFECLGATTLQKLYRQAKNAVSREFLFEKHTQAPEIPGVKEAYLGYISAQHYLGIIRGENGELARGIFDSNLRDFQSYNLVNTAIQSTLDSDERRRFVLMNNGVTIITRVLTRTGGNKFYIEDFQVVNGCQTSNVLFEYEGDLKDVAVPLRLIASDDEGIIQSIVTATNQQTQLSREQLFAATEFPKQLEQFCQAFPEPHKIFYERRSRQYDRASIDRLRIVSQANVIRAFAGMFTNEPHRTTKNFNLLLDNIGKTIFLKGHKLEPYYVSAYALYRLERMFKEKKIDSKFKAARFQMLMALRRLLNDGPVPNVGSKDMEKLCNSMMQNLWDTSKIEPLILKSSQVINDVTAGNLNRDFVRTVPITDAISKATL